MASELNNDIVTIYIVVDFISKISFYMRIIVEEVTVVSAAIEAAATFDDLETNAAFATTTFPDVYSAVI